MRNEAVTGSFVGPSVAAGAAGVLGAGVEAWATLSTGHITSKARKNVSFKESLLGLQELGLQEYTSNLRQLILHMTRVGIVA
jgi:hypothetical protein